jgi:hypothetical protein
VGVDGVWTAPLDGDPWQEQAYLDEGHVWTIVLDAVNGRIFYSGFFDDVEPEIRRVNLDGSGRTTLVDGITGRFIPLAVDLMGERLYWIENDQIWTSGFDSAERQIAVRDVGRVERLLVTYVPEPGGFALFVSAVVVLGCGVGRRVRGISCRA